MDSGMMKNSEAIYPFVRSIKPLDRIIEVQLMVHSSIGLDQGQYWCSDNGAPCLAGHGGIFQKLQGFAKFLGN